MGLGDLFRKKPKSETTAPEPPGDTAAILPDPTPKLALQPTSAEGVQAMCSPTNTNPLVTTDGVLFRPLTWGQPPRCIAIPRALELSLEQARLEGLKAGLEYGGWILHKGRSAVYVSPALRGQQGQFLETPWIVAEEVWNVRVTDIAAWKEENPELLMFHSHVFPKTQGRWQQAGHSQGDMDSFIGPWTPTRNITMVAGPLGIYAAVKTTETFRPPDFYFSELAIHNSPDVLQLLHRDWVADRVSEGNACKFYVYFAPWPAKPNVDYYVGLLEA